MADRRSQERRQPSTGPARASSGSRQRSGSRPGNPRAPSLPFDPYAYADAIVRRHQRQEEAECDSAQTKGLAAVAADSPDAATPPPRVRVAVARGTPSYSHSPLRTLDELARSSSEHAAVLVSTPRRREPSASRFPDPPPDSGCGGGVGGDEDLVSENPYALASRLNFEMYA